MSFGSEHAQPSDVHKLLKSFQPECYRLGIPFAHSYALRYFHSGYFGTPLTESQYYDAREGDPKANYENYVVNYLVKTQLAHIAAGAETYIACGLTVPEYAVSTVKSVVNLYKVNMTTGEALPYSSIWIGNVMLDGTLRPLVDGGVSHGFNEEQLQFALRLHEAQDNLGWQPILPKTNEN